MGIYDRDYYREDEPKGWFAGDRPMVVNLVLVTGGIYLFTLFTANADRSSWIEDHLSAQVATLQQPWLWWKFLTYGFLHDRANITHVLFNMLGLWFFGRDVEGIYGRKEFLRLYLTGLVLAGMGWAAIEMGRGGSASLVGASGAVTAVLVLFCCHFPHRQVLLWFIPVPAWFLAVFIVGSDVLRAMGGEQHVPGDSRVAFMAHLAGAAYGILYFKTQWSFGRLIPASLSWKSMRRRLQNPKVRVYQPPPRTSGADMQARVDEILEKISQFGQDSLTDEERKTLENASRHYQHRRQ